MSNLSIVSFIIITCVIVLLLLLTITVSKTTDPEYLMERSAILKQERHEFLGGKLDLSDLEKKVNEIILEEKHKELNKAYKNSSDFLAAINFIKSHKRIDQSPVFSIIKHVPKGGLLHVHLTGMASIEFLLNQTRQPNIHGCFINNNQFKLRFLQNASQDSRCSWKPLEEFRQNDSNFDDWLVDQISVRQIFETDNEVWAHFKKVFTTIYEMLSYRPVFEEFVASILEELYEDNVIYVEFKATIMKLYELDGFEYGDEDFFRILINCVNRFKEHHKDFLGARYIHSIYRGVDREILQENLNHLEEMQRKFPDFIIGIDLIGRESEGKPLKIFHDILTNAKLAKLKLFLHAGETEWFGHLDTNLVDAVLLNSSRIGHAFALAKHPILLQLVKDRDIAVELCPISNQVLMLNEDNRNHPGIVLMASGVGVVIGSDDPGLWGAQGLSHDWYMAFMGMTGRMHGIEVLKQFALNSIKYSVMGEEERLRAVEIWQRQWERFLNRMLE